MLIRFGVVAWLVTTPTSAVAQGFDAEVTCGDTWTAGNKVPFTARLAEHAQPSRDLEVTLKLTPPDGQPRTILESSFVLVAKRDRFLVRHLELPHSAKPGRYDLALIADDHVTYLLDTCSFEVR